MASRQGRIPFQKYRAVFWPADFATGKTDPEWMGFGYCPALHKSPWDARPYCIPNELIAARIGHALGLPIPPFGITAGEGGRLYFSSLDFNYTAKKTRSSPMSIERPPIIPAFCAANLSWLSTGITVFDVFIANQERNEEHIIADNPLDPKWLVAFDHDMALFGGDPPSPNGIDRLVAIGDGLGVNDGNFRHCLLDVHHEPADLTDWVKRVLWLPKYLLRDACDAAVSVGLKVAEADAAFKFLNERRERLGVIIKDNLHEFTRVKQWMPPHVLF